MNEGMKVTFVLAVVVAIVIIIGLVQESYAEAFPSIAYYEDRNERARVQYTPEPVLLPEFWINPLPRTVTCDTWFKVTGHAHDKGGILGMMAISETQYNTTAHIISSNLSYSTQYELQNYINIPCSDNLFKNTNMELYNVYFHWNPHPYVHPNIGLAAHGTTWQTGHTVEVILP
jgi:PDZ domain-containing secreted protein